MLLFVYGTLRSGERFHHFLAGTEQVCKEALLTGYRIELKSPFPRMVRTERVADEVKGELYEVGEELITELDAFEGVHENEYKREEVELNNGVKAQAYLACDQNYV